MPSIGRERLEVMISPNAPNWLLVDRDTIRWAIDRDIQCEEYAKLVQELLDAWDEPSDGSSGPTSQISWRICAAVRNLRAYHHHANGTKDTRGYPQ